MDAFSLGEELLILDGDNLKQRPMEELELVQDFLKYPELSPVRYGGDGSRQKRVHKLRICQMQQKTINWCLHRTTT